MKKLLIFFLFVALVGCSQNNADSTYEHNQDQAGTDLITNDEGTRNGGDFTNNGDNDMTMGDQNPNLLNTDDNENRHNFSQDVQKAKEVITAHGYEPGQIWINGGVMSVTAKQDKNLSRKKQSSAEKALREDLTKALPRYEINVEME